MRRLAIPDLRPGIVVFNVTALTYWRADYCYSVLVLGHSILSLGRPAWADRPRWRDDLVPQRGKEADARSWSSFDRNEGENAR
jgi:hypothetical protein